MPTASARTAIATCQLSESAPSHEEKTNERAIPIAAAREDAVRTVEKVLNFAVSINVTVARFVEMYAKIRR
jgi:hypothetical protein